MSRLLLRTTMTWSLSATLSRLTFKHRAGGMFWFQLSRILFLFAGVFVWKHAVDRTIWRRCRPQTEFHQFCFRTFLRREMTHRPHLQHLLWVHVLHSRPMLSLGQRWVQDKSDSDESQNMVFRWGGEKEMNLTIAAPLVDIYSQQDQGFVPPTSLLVAVASMTKQDGAFQTSASTCCTLLLMDLQDGKWIRKDEEAPVNRGTSKPGAWCFVFSASWTIFTCWVFVRNLRSCLALRTDCYGFLIPST